MGHEYSWETLDKMAKGFNAKLQAIITLLTNGIDVNQGIFVLVDSFDESDLTGGVYTTSATLDTLMGLDIINNNTTNPLTVTVGSIAIVVPAGKQRYVVCAKDTTIACAGTGADFDITIEG